MKVKRCLCAFMLILLISGCSTKTTDFASKFTIIDAKLISAEKHYKSATIITVQANGKTYVLKGGMFSDDILQMQKFAKTTNTEDTLQFDIMVNTDMFIDDIALSQARQH